MIVRAQAASIAPTKLYKIPSWNLKVMFAQNCDFNEIDENKMRNASFTTQSHTCIV